MQDIDFVFIVLVYRDYLDLEDLCESINKHVNGEYRVVVVDAFYDIDTSENVKKSAVAFECDYIQIENKGYGFGNNRGIEFANNHYNYKWLIICNPDTMVESEISKDRLPAYECVIGPDIRAKKRKHQNPYWPIENRLSEKLIYKGYSKEKKRNIYAGVGINKILKSIFILSNSFFPHLVKDIYACHGCFIFIEHNFARKFRYDEELFLFYEEAFFAFVAKRCDVPIIYDKSIKIYHKEDGSMNMENIIEYPYLKKSYLTYYAKCRIEKNTKGLNYLTNEQNK